jgi:pimeloyl-ACP methyl ester carboxylesterase
MARPRLLLIPQLTEIEWVIRPLLEEWADVACYDAPGVGDEPSVDDFGSAAVARRGLEEVEGRGWDRFFVVADEFGVAAATHLAVAAPESVAGLALGHARLSNSLGGDRPAVNREVHEACVSLIRNDPRMFVRQLFNLTGGEETVGGYDVQMVDTFLTRVPLDLLLPFWETRSFEGERIGDRLAQVAAPMLLAAHKGCLLFTPEGFDDAVTAFSQATTVSCVKKPSTSPEFSGVLREFCARHAAAPA